MRINPYEDATAELTQELPAGSPITEDIVIAAFPPSAARGIAQRPGPVGLQPKHHDIGPGSVLCERYKLEEAIGVGGTSTVYRARDLRREQLGSGGIHVALKTPRAELPSYHHSVERLKREFHLAQALTHPHVVRVFDLDNDDGRWFMTMELLEGRTLSAALAQSPFSSGRPPFTPRRAVDILRASGEALAFAHDRGVVHGDFKPGNIFLPVSGPLRVLDFGSAISAEPSLEPHAPAATACYASPEVMGGRRPDRRDDIFAFACVAHELLGGVHPFERRSAVEAQKAGWTPLRSWNLTDRQWYALQEALSFNREARPANIRTLLAELLPASPLDRVEVQDGIDVSEPTQNPTAPPMIIAPSQFRVDALSQPPARSWFRVTAVAAVVALAAVTAYFQTNNHPQWPQEVRDGSARLLADMKTRFQSAVGTAEATATAPATPASAAPLADTRSVSVRPASREALSTAQAFNMPLAMEAVAQPRRRAVIQPQMPLNIFVSFADEAVTVSEDATAVALRLKRDGNLDARTDVRWRVISAQGRASDLPTASGVAIFADGLSSRMLYVPLPAQGGMEKGQDFFVELYDPAIGARIWPTNRARVAIRGGD